MSKMRSSTAKRFSLVFFSFLFLSFLLIFVGDWGFIRGIRGLAEGSVVSIKSKIYQIKQPKIVDMEGINMQQIADLQNQIAVLKRENEAMKKLLGTPLPPSWKFQEARVIGFSSSNDLQIDKGRKEGINVGMTVVVDNFFIGKIVWAGEHFSRLVLPISSEAKILAISRSSAKESDGGIKARGIIYGFGGKMTLGKVLATETLNEGDLVSTAGDGELLPDLLIGKVGQVDSRVGEIYQSSEIKPLVDVRKLETVFVITGW